jgi:protein kinase A
MLLEYIPGGELFSHLRKQEFFDPILYKFYTVEIACALRHLHDLNIMYRDIKPENILINRSGHIRLCDFGFSKVLDTEDRTYTLCGTPEFVSIKLVYSSYTHLTSALC